MKRAAWYSAKSGATLGSGDGIVQSGLPMCSAIPAFSRIDCESIRWTRLRRTDDAVLLFLSIRFRHHVASDLDLVVVGSLIDHHGLLDHLLERHDAAFQEGLIVLGLLELGVLGEIAELHGGMDALCDPLALLRLERLELALDLLEPFRGDVDRLLQVVQRSLRSRAASGRTRPRTRKR